MKPTDTYTHLLTELGALLRASGFTRSGNRFHMRPDKNWGLIAFQKSRKSNAQEILFTVNLGICSHELTRFFSAERLDKRPSIEDCQWRERIGFLLPERQDRWWRIQTGDPLEPLVAELRHGLVRVAIPSIEMHLSDEQLCKEWSSGTSPGLTDIQRLVNLSVLQVAAGMDEALNDTIAEMERQSAGEPTAAMVRHHLSKLHRLRSVGGSG